MRSIVVVGGCCLAALLAGCSSRHEAGAVGPTDGGGSGAGCPATSTDKGPVKGTLSGATCAYEGIPYAAPPTGTLRWKAPVAATAWTTPPPSAIGPGCPQHAGYGGPSSAEDCLYLNVWTPALRPTHPAPVMVFVHGGGFVYGEAAQPVFNGANLAATTGNLVVTIDYRLGALGFLSNAALRSEDTAHGSAGNYGILDQIAALQWVHDNIAAFGGDPTGVTIFGHSAGAASMLVHLASPPSKGLFSRVIIESAPALYQSTRAAALPQSTADATGATFAMALGCTDPSTLLSCLRAASVADVLNAVPALNGGPAGANVWGPVVDGYVLPTEPIQAILAGSFTKVPTLVGNTRDDGREFSTVLVFPRTSQLRGHVDVMAPGHGAAIVAEYPIASYGDSYFDAASAALTDGRFLCPTRRVARAIAASGTPTFRYDFTYVIADCVGDGGLGAFHGAELLFVFGETFGPSATNDYGCNTEVVTLQPNEVPLSKAIMGYWGSMAKTGNPNGGGRFTWPQYDTIAEPEIVLDLTQSTEILLEKAQCDFWDAIGSTAGTDAGSTAGSDAGSD
jgi:para-nitrobenzyl esterase